MDHVSTSDYELDSVLPESASISLECPPAENTASPQLRHWPIAGGERSDEVGLPVERLPSRDVIILGKGLPAKE